MSDADTRHDESSDDLLVDATAVEGVTWSAAPLAGAVLVQVSAHGATAAATVVRDPADPTERAALRLRWHEPHRRVAPGQSVVLYDPGDRFVLGGGTAS